MNEVALKLTLSVFDSFSDGRSPWLSRLYAGVFEQYDYFCNSLGLQLPCYVWHWFVRV